MVASRLLVERGSLRDRSEDWGLFDFLSLPSPGDRIIAEHDGETHYLTVICVHHQPVAIKEEQARAPSSGPSASIAARWTGSSSS